MFNREVTMEAFYQHEIKTNQCRMGSSLRYNLHFHHNIEVVYMFKGTGCAVVDGNEYYIREGDILVVFPNQLHEYKKIDEEEYMICIFKPELLPEFKDIFYSKIPEKNIVSTENKNSLLLQTAKIMPEVKDSSKLYKEQIYRGLLLSFFGELLSHIQLKELGKVNLSTVKNILYYCNENYLNDISLDDVASKLHVSKYYISHLMNSKLNISFNDYINSLRISDACQLLEAGELDITEIAEKTGFNSLRTFNRVFKNIHRMSPSQYKKMSGKENQ